MDRLNYRLVNTRSSYARLLLKGRKNCTNQHE